MLHKIEQKIGNYMPYIRKFGIINGIKIVRTLFPKERSNKIVSVNIPQAKHAIKIRLGTIDLTTFQEIFLYTGYDLPVGLKPGLIIDGGANAGYASIFFLNQYPESTVLAIEPEISNFTILNENCLCYPNFRSIQSAIWRENTFLRICNINAGNTEFRVEETTERTPDTFKALTIEKILEDSEFEKIDILKLDIEGSEKEIFEDNYKKWLDRVDVLIIELHDRFKPGCSTAFNTAMEKHNFLQYSSGVNLVYRKA